MRDRTSADDAAGLVSVERLLAGSVIIGF